MICYYDNADLQRREEWHNGTMTRCATTEFLKFAYPEDFYGFPEHEWVDGQTVGDTRALGTTIQKVAHRGDK